VTWDTAKPFVRGVAAIWLRSRQTTSLGARLQCVRYIGHRWCSAPTTSATFRAMLGARGHQNFGCIAWRVTAVVVALRLKVALALPALARHRYPVVGTTRRATSHRNYAGRRERACASASVARTTSSTRHAAHSARCSSSACAPRAGRRPHTRQARGHGDKIQGGKTDREEGNEMKEEKSESRNHNDRAEKLANQE
jgi:hypothetical protein